MILTEPFYLAVQPTTHEGKACARLLELAAREPDKVKKVQLDISEKVSPEKAKNLAIALAKDPAFASFKWLKLNVYLLGEHLAEIAEILTGAKHLESIRYRIRVSSLLLLLLLLLILLSQAFECFLWLTRISQLTPMQYSLGNPR